MSNIVEAEVTTQFVLPVTFENLNTNETINGKESVIYKDFYHINN